MAIKDLQDLFLHTMKDIYFAENHIKKALPKMAEKASNSELSKLFSSHLEETNTHIERLEKAFETLGEKASGEECPAIEGIVKEAKELMDEIKDKETLDAALIASAQAVEHYEITRYGSLISWAQELGHDDARNFLEQNLGEEKDADMKLTRIGEDKLNKKAA